METLYPHLKTICFAFGSILRSAARWKNLARSSLSFIQALNLFIQQTIDTDGLPIPINKGNGALVKAKAIERLLSELKAGR